MSSLVVDLILVGLAYVVLIYFIATLTRNKLSRNKDSNDDGDGGVEDFTPPKIDLPPGVIWPSDAPSKKTPRKPVEV